MLSDTFPKASDSAGDKSFQSSPRTLSAFSAALTASRPIPSLNCSVSIISTINCFPPMFSNTFCSLSDSFLYSALYRSCAASCADRFCSCKTVCAASVSIAFSIPVTKFSFMDCCAFLLCTPFSRSYSCPVFLSTLRCTRSVCLSCVACFCSFSPIRFAFLSPETSAWERSVFKFPLSAIFDPVTCRIS